MSSINSTQTPETADPATPQVHLDFPVECPSVFPFQIVGWVTSTLPVRAVRLKDKPGIAFELVPRPDVIRAYPDRSHASGFRGEVRDVPPDRKLQIELLLGDEWVTHPFKLKKPKDIFEGPGKLVEEAPLQPWSDMKSSSQNVPQSQPVSDTDSTRFHLEVPAECPTAPQFHVSGWVAGSLPLRAARFKDRPEIALALVMRPDVAKAFPDCPHTAGFQGLGPEVPPDASLSIEFMTGETWVTRHFELREAKSTHAAPAIPEHTAYNIGNDPDVSYEPPADPEALLAPDGMIYPSLELCGRIGSPTHESFWTVGVMAKKIISRSLPLDWTFKGKRVLDFGCGVGRVLRHFAPEAREAEFWGCDIDLRSVMWMNRHFSPPFRVFQNRESATLPLESDSFELVYATSVFSHLNETWNQWLMELRRILRPGGYAFLSFLNRTPYERIYGQPFPNGKIGMLVKHPGQPWDHGGPNVFISPEWLVENWGGIFDIEFIALEGLGGFQSIAMLRKPAPFSLPKGSAPIIRSMGTLSALNSDARAQITFPDLQDRTLIEGYGLRGKERILIAGWAAFRGSELAGVRFTIGENCIAHLGSDSISKSGELPDFGGAPYCSFEHEIDVSTLASGTHTLRLDYLGRQGESHWSEVQLIIES
ncbi:hypothetical protein BH11VER1_BH11VER1_26510 [soil metagenome]